MALGNLNNLIALRTKLSLFSLLILVLYRCSCPRHTRESVSWPSCAPSMRRRLSSGVSNPPCPFVGVAAKVARYGGGSRVTFRFGMGRGQRLACELGSLDHGPR